MTVRHLNEARQQWTQQWRLLEQLSRKVFEQNFDDTYEFSARQVRERLNQMQKIVELLPNKEPYGPNYADAVLGLCATLQSLEATSKLLEKAAKDYYESGLEAGWSRALESSKR